MRYLRSAAFLAATILVFASAFGGSTRSRSASSASQATGNDLYRPFLINSIFNYYGNNGDGSYNKFSTTNEGVEFTRGSGKTCVFEDGVVWGGYHKGRTTPKVGGSVYRHGLQAGPIVQNGTPTTDPTADDPTFPANRIYRVRPDINPATPFASVQAIIASGETAYIGRYESYADSDIYNQYIMDWNQWPAAEGAPFAYGKDSNNVQRTSGPYDPRFDIPGEPGADQTLWYVANDCDPARTIFLAGSPVIGLEMQRTIWGYRKAGAPGQTIYMRTRILNRSGAAIDTMYLGQFADPDLGDGIDDFVGCDSARSLGFDYHSKPLDAVYGTAIPAVGFCLLQGPVVPGSPSDTAAFASTKRPGYRNLRMSSFVLFASGGVVPFVDPTQGAGGDAQWYNLLRGTIATSGAPFTNPVTGLPTKFCVSGDPVAQTGWRDGTFGLTPGDRRFGMSTGPFRMAAGDTQEIVVAVIVGLGADYIASVSVLKSYADKIQSDYDARTGVGPVLGVSQTVTGIPSTNLLMQNYPNPFNPTTTIKYTLYREAPVRLALFNTLGQQVALLASGVETAGEHSVRFDATGLASGMYIYRLQAGEFVSARKLLIVR